MAETTSSSLCALCHMLIDSWKRMMIRPETHDRDAPVPHHRDLRELNISAMRGCVLCAQFTEAYRADYHKDFNNSIGGVVRYDIDEKNGRGSMNFRSTSEQGVQMNLGLSVMLEPISDTMLSTLPFEVSASRKSTRTALPLCKAWLNACLNTHNHSMRMPALSKDLPTRLLFLGDNNRVRLCQSKNLAGTPNYAAMSHCWGKTHFQTLVKRNIQAFQVEIPEEALSKSFRDAVEIARYLDIAYLWIDSLCIIQDDPDDWAREAALMASVYGCSFVTIAASSASDGNMGCLFDQNRPWKCQIPAVFRDKQRLFSFFASANPLFNSPMATRGWIYQERIMSPRTLHFTSSEVFGDCDELLVSETFPHGASSMEDGFSPSLLPTTLLEWCHMMQEYTHRKLTVPTDRLVAVSAIAQQFHVGNKYEYVAGLWTQNFQIQLCWYVLNPPVLDNLRQAYVAPSWSWASIDGPVDFVSIFAHYSKLDNSEIWPMKEYSRIRKFNVTLASEDPFGGIICASVSLTCKHILLCQKYTFQFEVEQYSSRLQCLGGDKWTASYWNDSAEVIDESTRFECDLGGEGKLAAYEVFLVPLFFSGHYDCLVLRRSPHNLRHFRRIGLASADLELIPGTDHQKEFSPHPNDWAENDTGIIIEPDEEWGWSYTIEIV